MKCVLLCLLAASAASAQTPGFWLTGLAPNTTQGTVLGLSQDGSVAVGWSGSSGFTWTRQGGRVDFGLQAGMPNYTPAYSVSNDGSTLVGRMTNSGEAGMRAYRWTGTGPLQDLGVLPNETRSYGFGISGDGSVVVGACEHSSSTEFAGQAFRWNAATGMVGLGYTRPDGTFSQARAISRDGGTIVGTSKLSGVYADAFVWSQAGGMHALPTAPGAPFIQYEADAVNAAGTVIVGGGPVDASGFPHPLRWTTAGLQDLGVLPGLLSGIAYTVSDDGLVVGGQSGNLAWIWTPTLGTRLLTDYLAASGVSAPPGYRLENVFAISGDGRTMAGGAFNLSTGLREGFVATVPEPSSILVLLSLPALTRRKRPAA